MFKNLHGKAALTPRGELPLDWTLNRRQTSRPSGAACSKSLGVLKAEEGGGDAAAKLVAQMGSRAADAQKLAYRLFEIATRKGLNERGARL